MKEIPEFPTGFLKESKEIWTLIWSGNPHLVKERDALHVQILCEIWQEYRVVLKESKKNPRTLKQPNGIFQTHPYVKQLQELRKEILSLTSTLGLSPLDASKLDLPDYEKMKRVEEIQKRPDRAALVAAAKENS